MVPDVAHALDSQQLFLVHLPQHQKPALVFGLREPRSLCLTVLLSLKDTHTHVNVHTETTDQPAMK